MRPDGCCVCVCVAPPNVTAHCVTCDAVGRQSLCVVGDPPAVGGTWVKNNRIKQPYARPHVCICSPQPEKLRVIRLKVKEHRVRTTRCDVCTHLDVWDFRRVCQNYIFRIECIVYVYMDVVHSSIKGPPLPERCARAHTNNTETVSEQTPPTSTCVRCHDAIPGCQCGRY